MVSLRDPISNVAWSDVAAARSQHDAPRSFEILQWDPRGPLKESEPNVTQILGHAWLAVSYRTHSG